MQPISQATVVFGLSRFKQIGIYKLFWGSQYHEHQSTMVFGPPRLKDSGFYVFFSTRMHTYLVRHSDDRCSNTSVCIYMLAPVYINANQPAK